MSRAPRYRWTEKELDRLYAYCNTRDKINASELSKIFPNRTITSIKAKIDRLKLRRYLRGRQWEKSNDKYLLKAIDALSEQLHTTPDSVMRRAGQLYRANH